MTRKLLYLVLTLIFLYLVGSYLPSDTNVNDYPPNHYWVKDKLSDETWLYAKYGTRKLLIDESLVISSRGYKSGDDYIHIAFWWPGFHPIKSSRDNISKSKGEYSVINFRTAFRPKQTSDLDDDRRVTEYGLVVREDSNITSLIEDEEDTLSYQYVFFIDEHSYRANCNFDVYDYFSKVHNEECRLYISVNKELHFVVDVSGLAMRRWSEFAPDLIKFMYSIFIESNSEKLDSVFKRSLKEISRDE